MHERRSAPMDADILVSPRSWHWRPTKQPDAGVFDVAPMERLHCLRNLALGVVHGRLCMPRKRLQTAFILEGQMEDGPSLDDVSLGALPDVAEDGLESNMCD